VNDGLSEVGGILRGGCGGGGGGGGCGGGLSGFGFLLVSASVVMVIDVS
jgi:hypothetical protein